MTVSDDVRKVHQRDDAARPASLLERLQPTPEGGAMPRAQPSATTTIETRGCGIRPTVVGLGPDDGDDRSGSRRREPGDREFDEVGPPSVG